MEPSAKELRTVPAARPSSQYGHMPSTCRAALHGDAVALGSAHTALHVCSAAKARWAKLGCLADYGHGGAGEEAGAAHACMAAGSPRGSCSGCAHPRRAASRTCASSALATTASDAAAVICGSAGCARRQRSRHPRREAVHACVR